MYFEAFVSCHALFLYRFFFRFFPLTHHYSHPRGSFLRSGMHRVNMYHLRRKVHFVIMASVFDTPAKIHTIYDLKGSLTGRAATAEERENGGVLKDNDLLKDQMKFHLGPKKAAFIAQLKKDADFLAHLNIMDYSLLVGIHNRSQRPPQQFLQQVLPPAGIPPQVSSADAPSTNNSSSAATTTTAVAGDHKEAVNGHSSSNGHALIVNTNLGAAATNTSAVHNTNTSSSAATVVLDVSTSTLPTPVAAATSSFSSTSNVSHSNLPFRRGSINATASHAEGEGIDVSGGGLRLSDANHSNDIASTPGTFYVCLCVFCQ